MPCPFPLISSLTLGNVAQILASKTCGAETGLAGWRERTRTPKCRRKLSLSKLARILRIRAEFRPWRPLAFELQRRGYAARAGFCRDLQQAFCTDVGHHAASPRMHELAAISFDQKMIRRRQSQQHHCSVCAGLSAQRERVRWTPSLTGSRLTAQKNDAPNSIQIHLPIGKIDLIPITPAVMEPPRNRQVR